MAPKNIIIVPYRDREKHKNMFLEQMVHNFRHLEDYKIYFAHQDDNRPFNRGAMKNIGFLVVKDLYPDNYKDITLVFNDVDTLPYTKNFIDYNTTNGIVKHFFGFKFALGGILSIKAGDFELINGFPNFWAWGYEDNALQARAIKHKIKIDRSNMLEPGSNAIIHLKDDILKTVNKEEYQMYKEKSNEGYKNIVDLEYYYNDTNGFLNVKQFNTGREENIKYSKKYNITKGNTPFRKRKPTINMVFS